MLKIIGGAAIIGAFIGAMAVEILNRYITDLSLTCIQYIAQR